MSCDTDWLRRLVRIVPDFPDPGVGFYDIAPLLGNVDGFRFCVDALADAYAGTTIDHIVGIEARGFLFASPLAYRCGAGLILARKANKLPGTVEGEDYSLEYGTDRLEIQAGAVSAGENVLVVDDVLATGGTAAAAGRLVERLGANLVGFGFLIELSFLGGRAALEDHEAVSLLDYPE